MGGGDIPPIPFTKVTEELNGLNLPQTFSHFQNTHIHPPILDQGQVKHTLNSTGRIMDMGRLPPLYLVGTSS